MEKRNFVTSIRTSEESAGVDELVDNTVHLFGGNSQNLSKKASEYEKKASAEDEKSDSIS